MPRMPARPHGVGKKEARAFEARGKWQPTYQRAGQWGHGPTIQVHCKQHHPAVEPSPDHHTHPQQLSFWVPVFYGEISHHVVPRCFTGSWAVGATPAFWFTSLCLGFKLGAVLLHTWMVDKFVQMSVFFIRYLFTQASPVIWCVTAPCFMARAWAAPRLDAVPISSVRYSAVQALTVPVVIASVCKAPLWTWPCEEFGHSTWGRTTIGATTSLP